MSQLFFKFTNTTSESSKEKILKNLSKLDPDTNVGRLLPEIDEEDELSNMFVVDSKEESKLKIISVFLTSNSNIEFVDGPIERKPNKGS